MIQTQVAPEFEDYDFDKALMRNVAQLKRRASYKEKLIKPNLSARVKINDYQSEKAILIPQNLISENAEGTQYVYTIGKNTKNETIALQKIIETGKTQGSLIEILKGIDYNIRFVGDDWKDKPFTGHDLPGHLNKVLYNSRQHDYSSSALRRRVTQGETKEKKSKRK